MPSNIFMGKYYPSYPECCPQRHRAQILVLFMDNWSRCGPEEYKGNLSQCPQWIPTFCCWFGLGFCCCLGAVFLLCFINIIILYNTAPLWHFHTWYNVFWSFSPSLYPVLILSHSDFPLCLSNQPPVTFLSFCVWFIETLGVVRGAAWVQFSLQKHGYFTGGYTTGENISLPLTILIPSFFCDRVLISQILWRSSAGNVHW